MSETLFVVVLGTVVVAFAIMCFCDREPVTRQIVSSRARNCGQNCIARSHEQNQRSS
jgi:hypothetical protein